MKQTDFMLLKNPEQIELLYNKAVYIGKRKERRSVLVLYQLDSFYVEIRYLSYRRHIGGIITFDSVDLLDPYLQSMDVEELINC